MLYSNKCEVKWVYRKKGVKKTSKKLNKNIKTIMILISGKCLTKFPSSENKKILLEKFGDYLVYEGNYHETETIKNSRFLVIRWKNEKG